MNQHSVAEHQGSARRNAVATVLVAIVAELSESERIRREQPVGSRVPVGWVAEIIRVVENSNADVFSRNIPVVVDPVGPLTPNRFLTARTSRIHHVARR